MGHQPPRPSCLHQFNALAASLGDDQSIVCGTRARHNDVDSALANLPIQPCRQTIAQCDILCGVNCRRRLDQQIDVATSAAVIGARSEQQDPAARRQCLSGRPSNVGDFGVGQSHRASIGSGASGLAGGRCGLGRPGCAFTDRGLIRSELARILGIGNFRFMRTGLTQRHLSCCSCCKRATRPPHRLRAGGPAGRLNKPPASLAHGASACFT